MAIKAASGVTAGRFSPAMTPCRPPSALRQNPADAQAGLQARTLIVPQGQPAPAGLHHQALVQVAPPVLKKLTGLETPDSITAVAELDLPQPADLRASAGGRACR
jgi:hypothetical protein